MSGFLTIFRRELSAYFNSAIAYIFLVVFVIFTNGLFMLQFFQTGKADMRMLFQSLPFILNIFIPAVAMRLWAEDKKGNTFELLLTFPMRPGALVAGKYLASLVFYALALAATLTVPVMISFIGSADPGPIVGGYLGSLLMGALFLAAGLFISGLCRDQIVAFILSVIACFALHFFGTDYTAAFVDGWIPGAGTLLKNTFGMAGRLSGFARGILDFGDAAYFVVGVGAFLLLNGLSLEGRLRPRSKAVFSAAVVVCLVSAAVLNWLLLDLPLGRIDMTQGKIYTISDVSLRILKGLKVPVQVKVYLSPVDSMPTLMKTLERDVTDKLEELRVNSDGKFRYRVVHLDAVSEEKEAGDASLKESGIVPFQVESVQKDEVGVKLIYSTLVIEYKEKPREIIPRLVPQTLQDLEYQLLSRIHKMTLEEKPQVTFYAAAEEGEGAAETEDSFRTAKLLVRNNGYRVARTAITADDPIPPSTSNLILLDPGALTARQRFEINRYLYRGGTAVIGAEPFLYTYERGERGVEAVPAKRPLDVNRLLESWGLKISEEMLLDENSQIVSISTGQSIGPYALEMPVKLPNQILVDEAAMNREASLTNRLPTVFYLWGTAIEMARGALDKSGLRPTVLFSSSPRSWKKPNDGSLRLSAQNTAAPPGKLEGGFPLAVLVEGQFSDATGGQPAPAWKEGDPEGPKMDGAKPGRLLLVGSSKAFSEELIQSPGNINLFANIVDGLTLSEDLVQIRSKSGVVRDIRRLSTAEKVLYRFFTVLLVPALLAAFAAARFFVRRKEKEMYVAALARPGERA